MSDPIAPPGYFVCAHCGGTFRDLTELLGHDPVAEAAEAFPDLDPANGITICDDCYARYVGEPS